MNIEDEDGNGDGQRDEYHGEEQVFAQQRYR